MKLSVGPVLLLASMTMSVTVVSQEVSVVISEIVGGAGLLDALTIEEVRKTREP